MAFSKLTLGQMLDWIRANTVKGLPAPTDAEIQEHFGFSGPERARTLLAELADQGAITIQREGGERVGIVIGRAPPWIAAVGRVTPAIKAPQPPKAKSRRDMMLDILARRNEEAAKTAEPATTPQAPASAGELDAPPALPPVPSIEHAQPAPPAVARVTKGPAARQITFTVDAATYHLLAAEGENAGLAVGRVARDRFFTTLAQPARKPLVSAAVAAAAVERGQPLHEFVSDLIQIGFAEHKRQNGSEAPTA